jgi:hypothetical protein
MQFPCVDHGGYYGRRLSLVISHLSLAIRQW